jgi:hypothetical protein
MNQDIKRRARKIGESLPEQSPLRFESSIMMDTDEE